MYFRKTKKSSTLIPSGLILTDQIYSMIGENYKWLFSGVGVLLFGAIVKVIRNLFFSSRHNLSVAEIKNNVFILFIDDDSGFKVAEILKNGGWLQTKLIEDIATLNDIDVKNAHIIFIDVQGVGKNLGFSEEGLGLASALKEYYPLKRVVIYSSETTGDRFHEALRKVDSFLPKNADPYEFQQLVERLAREIVDEGSL